MKWYEISKKMPPVGEEVALMFVVPVPNSRWIEDLRLGIGYWTGLAADDWVYTAIPSTVTTMEDWELVCWCRFPKRRPPVTRWDKQYLSAMPKPSS